MQWAVYLCDVRGGGMVALWAAEEQDRIWHITVCVGLMRGSRHQTPAVLPLCWDGVWSARML